MKIVWLEDAAGREVDPRLRIMRPWEIRYEWLEPEVRELVRALNDGGAVETLSSCGGHPFEEPCEMMRGRAAVVHLHVLDEPAWREAALAVAFAVRSVPSVTVTAGFGHGARLVLEVPRLCAPADRRALLDAAMAAAVEALESWMQRHEGLAAD